SPPSSAMVGWNGNRAKIPRSCCRYNGASVDEELASECLSLVGRAPVGERSAHEQSSLRDARLAAGLQRGDLLAQEGKAVPLLPGVDGDERREVAAHEVLLRIEVEIAAVVRGLPEDLDDDLLVLEDEVDDRSLPRLGRLHPAERRRRAE